jgi:hypothetical protein
MTVIRKRGSKNPPAASAAPKYLTDRYVPLREAIRWANIELENCPAGDAFEIRLTEVGEALVPRLISMFGSKNEQVILAAAEVFVKLRKLAHEREASRLSFLGRSVDAAAMESVGRMQADVERGTDGAGSPAMVVADLLPRVRAMVREEIEEGNKAEGIKATRPVGDVP